MQLLFQMAHLPEAEIAARRETAKQDILRIWETMKGSEVYIIQCPCLIDCQCMDEDEYPKIVITNCLHVGELDFFYVMQPFKAKYGFSVRWHCDYSVEEMACGFPMP